MEANLERDCGAYGSLFLSIISELRGSSIVWEDFTSKATKLHTSLKSTLVAVAAFLEAFQKVADMATSSRGATKEIGSALTRLCLRHKAIETKLKKFTGTIQENIVTPIQESMEDWKKIVVQLDKDHAKEYKKSRLEIKKCAADTAKLQKKVKKGKSDMQGRLDSAIQDVNDKYILLEEQEKNALRNVLVEERGRFCLFISCLKPFVDEEIGLLTEVTHLQEIMDHLCLQADNPKALPAASEQIIKDLKGKDTDSWKFQTPPSSPSSIGSRKSSMCSINSIASSSSGSVQSHSPCHNKNIQQQQAQLLGSGVRLTSVSSQDSGFTSQDTLFLRPTTPSSLNLQTQISDSASLGTDTPEVESTPSTPSESYPNTPSATSTWKNWPNPPNTANKNDAGRPHTISSAYEKSHARPALSSQTFEPPQESLKSNEEKHDATVIKRDRPHSTAVPYNRPSAAINKMQPVLPPLGPKPKSRAVAPPKVPPTGEPPIYANLNELSPGEEVDADRTPTDREPSDSSGLHPKLPDDLDLTEAIRDLDTYTAALHGDFTPGDRRSKRQQNSLELAAAIKELEASTKALEFETDKQSSQASLQCSSGYGTMSSTPATSEDTIASGDYVDSGQKYPNIPEHEKYFTIPRNCQMFRTAFQSKRPASTAGIPMSAQGGVIARRSSMNQPKPPPPVRRSSSISSGANPALVQKYRNSPPKQLAPQQTQPHATNAQQQQPIHRQSGPVPGTEPAYAELQEIQQSIKARHLQQQQQQLQMQGYNYGAGGQSGLGPTAVPPKQSPQYAEPVTIVNSSTVNSLETKLSSMHLTQTQQITSTSSSIMSQPVSSTGFAQPATGAHGAAGSDGDFQDLPPPPTEDELRELEKIYSVPKGNVSQTQFHNQTQNSLQLRQQPAQQMQPQSAPAGGLDFRQSLISEMKSGNKFRKLSKSDQGSESQC